MDDRMLDRTPPNTPALQEADRAARIGFAYALTAYLLWGFLPLYMKAVAHIPPLEVVAHRVLWSLPAGGVILLMLGRTADLAAALRSPRTIAMAAVTALTIGANWGVYVWAIAVGRTIETALGYYVNPLVTVLIGALVLGEKLNRWQLVALALAAMAVAVLAVEQGGVPWVSLFLAGTFAGYGYLRKTLPIGPSQGFFLEVMLLTPLAAGYLLWLAAYGGGTHFLEGHNWWLLAAAGPATAVPLILYASGAKRLRLATIGIMQYIAPTIIAALGVFVFAEPFGPGRIVAFALIWAALAIYTLSMFRTRPGA